MEDPECAVPGVGPDRVKNGVGRRGKPNIVSSPIAGPQIVDFLHLTTVGDGNRAGDSLCRRKGVTAVRRCRKPGPIAPGIRFVLLMLNPECSESTVRRYRRTAHESRSQSRLRNLFWRRPRPAVIRGVRNRKLSD